MSIKERILFWLFKRSYSLWDFEGRCEECAKRLPITVVVRSKRSVTITTDKCPLHPEGAMILWPQRGDIKEVIR